MRHFTAEERVRLVRRHDEDGVSWVQLGEEVGVPVRTLYRWAAAYRADPTLAGQRRRSRGDRGTRVLPEDLVHAVEGLALRRPVPTVAFIHRRITDIATERGLPAPSYTTVRRIVIGIDPGLKTLGLEGGAAYRDRFELVHRRTATAPNEQWQADHTLLDVMILDPKHEPARPWLTVILDDYSRAVAGYTVFLGAPAAEQTALAFHHAVTSKPDPGWPVCGLPDVLYSDHGADFISARLDRVCLETHVRLIHSRPGIPQGRGKIERFFRTLNTELLPHLPGYIPHGSNGTSVTPPALTLEQLDQAIGRFIIDEYQHRQHSSTKEEPAVRWAAGGWIPRMPAHPEDLDLLLLTAATGRKVQRDGIRFAATRYVSTVLAAYVGEQVTIRYNPRDVSEIRVYYQDQFLCRAIAPELATEEISLKQLQTARATRRRELTRQLNARRSLADALPDDTRYHPTNTDPDAEPQPDPSAQQPRKPGHGLRTYVNE